MEDFRNQLLELQSVLKEQDDVDYASIVRLVPSLLEHVANHHLRPTLKN